MKKISLFLVMLFATVVATASNINLHLTGCTSDESNPTEYTDEDESGIELYFTAEAGYTLSGWEVSIYHGETEIPVADWSSAIGYAYVDASSGYVWFYYTGDITEDFDVTVVCQEAQAVEGEFPAVFSAATFEDITIAENSVYRPESLVAGDNYWFSGAVRFRTDVQDYGEWGKYYFATQAVSYTEGYEESDYSDAYLPGAKGAAEGNNYGVINPSGAFEQIHFTKTTLSGMAVTNTAFNVNAILDGDGMSQEDLNEDGQISSDEKGLPFHEGDYFLLTIKGLDSATVTGTIEFYLADFRDAENMVYAENWQWIDLSSLGEIDGLQFELSSTKSNSYGMTTAAYFCVDNIGGSASECSLGEMTVAGGPTTKLTDVVSTKVSKMLKDGKLLIRKGNNVYDMNGAKVF